MVGGSYEKKMKNIKFDFRDKVIVITGSTRGIGYFLAKKLNYIGSKLVTKLLNYNYQVTVIDILKFSSKSLN